MSYKKKKSHLGHTPVYVKKGKRRKENYDLENDSPREFLVPHLENKINLKYVRNRSKGSVPRASCFSHNIPSSRLGKKMTVAPIYNPYAKNNRHALSAGNHGSRIAASHGSNNQPRTFLEIMGCQSQMREGSIKKCRKKATKAKYKRNLVQAAVTGGRAFDATNDCRICRAKLKAKQLKRLGVILRIPHRSHDPRCGKNIETRAMSKRWVEVNKTVAENLATNNEPLEHGLLATGTTAAQKAAALGFFQNLQKEKLNTSNEKTDHAPKNMNGFFDARMVETTLGTELCQEP